ncbi:GYF domain-containing protein, partial [Akkermansia sp.]
MASQRTPLYHYRVKDKIVGPICLTDLHALLVSKKILPDTMIREEHSQCWMPLAT